MEQWKQMKSIKHLPLLANKELFSDTAPADYSCRHIEVDLSNSGLTYETGDHLAIYPHNCPSKVERAAARLGVNLDRYFTLTPKPGANRTLSVMISSIVGARVKLCIAAADEAAKFPEPCTLRSAFTRHIDLHSFPKSDVLK